MPRSRKSTTQPPSETPPVRYYPRRVGARSSPVTLSPSQALHLATDPTRAARAERTAERRHYQGPPVRRGRLRRWLHTFRR